ncbi:mannose-binding protein [Streptomyces luteogriseus]|uniref:mannose-binding protein n=1 Tax=Streptomyces luteogriseus TaxID=68233 RepID=UPI0037A6D8FF
MTATGADPNRPPPRGTRPPDAPASDRPRWPRRHQPVIDSRATEEEYRMSRENQSPEANAEAAAALGPESGTPPTEEATPEGRSARTPTQAPTGAPESGPASAQTPTPTPAPAPAPGTEPDTPASGSAAPTAEPSPAGEATNPAAEPAATEPATTPPSPSAATRATTSPEPIAVAAAATAPPGVKAGTGTDSSRPRKPVLAGAAILGAALVAIPLLLTGSGRDEGPRDNAKALAAEGSDTVLNPETAPAELGDYVAEKPSASPSKDKPKKPAPPKTVAPPPAAPASEPAPSGTPEKKPKAKPKPKPKPSPRPKWSTETVYATSVLEVNQAWTTNRIRMVMQTDGNLVVYNEHGKPTWASMTFGKNHRAIFQADGNLVIHNGDDRPIWASKTHGNEGARMVLRTDGKVVIQNQGRVIWST